MPRVKVVALYRKPDDVDAFIKHYHDVHLPLVRQTPGLDRLEVSRVFATGSGGEPEYILVTEMEYPDRDTFRSAMRSEQNKAVVNDLRQFPPGLSTVLVSEVEVQE